MCRCQDRSPWMCTSVTTETIREGRASRTELMGKEQPMRLRTRPNFVTAELCRTLPRDKDAIVEGSHFGLDSQPLPKGHDLNILRQDVRLGGARS